MPSDLQKFADDYLRDIDRGVDASVRRLLREYDRSWASISAELEKVLAKIERDGVRSPSWVFQRERLQALLDQIAVEVDRLAASGSEETRQNQSRVIDLAQARIEEFAWLATGADRAERELTKAIPELGLSGLRAEFARAFTRLPDRAFRSFIGFAGDGSPLDEVFKRRAAQWGAASGATIRDTLAVGISNGWNPRKTAREIRRRIEETNDNPEKPPRLVRDLERIARTETLRANRNANTLAYEANKDIIEEWQWVCALSGSCLGCIGKHGQRFPVGTPMESHPNCRCTQRPVVKSLAEILGRRGQGLPDTRPPEGPTGEEWFAALSKDDQAKIMHPAVLEAYLDGTIAFKETWRVTASQKWGESVGPVPVKDVLGDAAARYEERARRYAESKRRNQDQE